MEACVLRGAASRWFSIFLPHERAAAGDLHVYTPDGYMSAQLSKPDRKPYASGDWFKGTDDDYKQEASTYIAYTGEFHVDQEAKKLTHSMFISLFPNWIGRTQPRIVKIEDDDLHLSSASLIQSGGKTVMSISDGNVQKQTMTLIRAVIEMR